METGTDVFKAKISATDDASTTIAAIKAKLHGLGGAAHEAGEKVKHLQQEGVFAHLKHHTHEAGEQFHEMGEHVATVGEKIAELVPAIGALGAAGGLVAMLETTEKVAEAYGELAHTAEGLGVQTQQLHEWNIVAKLTDTNADSMDRSMARLNRTLGDVTHGKNKDAAALFAQLHLDPKNFKNSADALPALADAFQHTHDATMRARMAQVLFGKAGVEMIPLLMKGSAGIQELQAQAKKLGFDFSESGEGLEAYNQNMKRLGVATDSFKDAIGADLAPVLAPVIADMTDWVAANRDWIAADMAGEVKQLADWLHHVPWHDVGAEIKEWAHDAEWFVDKIGGAKVVVGAFAAAMVMKGAVFLFAETVQVGKFAAEMVLSIARLGLMAAGWLGVGAAATEAAAAEEIANKAAGGGVGGAAKAAAKVLAPAALEEAGGVAASAAGGASVAGAATVLGAGALAGVVAGAVAVPLAVGLKKAVDAIDHASGLDKYEHPNANMRGGNRNHVDPPRRGELLHPAPPPPDLHGSAAGAPKRAVAPAPGHAAAAPVTAKVDGKVAVTVDLHGAPPGTTVSAKASGDAAAPKANVGHAFAEHF